MRHATSCLLLLSLGCTVSAKIDEPVDAPPGTRTVAADGFGPFQGDFDLCDEDASSSLSRRVPYHFWSFETDGCGEAAFDVRSAFDDSFVLLYRWDGFDWTLVDYNDDCGSDTLDSCIELTLEAGEYLVGASTYEFVRQRRGVAADYTLSAVCRDEGACEGPQACGSRGLPLCGEDEYCAYEASALCGRADAPGACTPRPDACAEIFRPVCGCNGQTYGNACEAASFGVSVDYDGRCVDPGASEGEFCGGIAGIECADGLFCDGSENTSCGADLGGVCALEGPVACPRNYDPVCGCDGETYQNDCMRVAEGVALDHEGACGGTPAGEGDACGGEGATACEGDLFCDFSRNLSCGENLSGVCKVDDAIFCPAYYDPVCGCDGVTYSNDCHRSSAGVAFDRRGRCEDDGSAEGEGCGGIAGLECASGLICDLSANTFCGADLAGTCRIEEPRICPAIADPVCGCDGRSYGNECERANAGVARAHRGLCEE